MCCVCVCVKTCWISRQGEVKREREGGREMGRFQENVQLYSKVE